MTDLLTVLGLVSSIIFIVVLHVWLYKVETRAIEKDIAKAKKDRELNE